mmetsp:Transcript_46469/g.132487  ORF Transcript_46469/g.132487 Transcript_46469/m.132487 type:complete len:502 (-) Transcript_46469:57-1562(-)
MELPQDLPGAAVALGIVTALVAILTVARQRQQLKTSSAAPYDARDYLTHDDLVDSRIRGNHLAFNAHLHQTFSGQQFVPVIGEESCFIAFEHATCREVMKDATSFSSNPFPDGRLVALNTMDKADHTRVLRYVHAHYAQAEVERLQSKIQATIERCTDELERGGAAADAMLWAKRVHMTSTLLRLGLAWDAEPDSGFVDEVIALNDAMVALVAPLGGIGRKYTTLPWSQGLRVVWGLLCSLVPTVMMFRCLGFRCTWEIVRPDVTVFWPPAAPRMGLWWHPELLPLVPRYFLALHSLLVGDACEGGPLAGIRGGLEKGDLRMAEALTLLVQLMVNMTSANALASLLFRLGTERTESARLVAEPNLRQAFVQEVLRLDAPLQRNPRRVVRLGDRWAVGPLRVGDHLLVMLGAANMDPAVFQQPEEFRLDRTEKERAALLSFGTGMHYCLGSNLVKSELKLALDCLIQRYASIEVTDCERLVDIDVGNWGFRHLHVRLSTRAT